jgi:ABC-type molybdate transport system substrate-binding protein
LLVSISGPGAVASGTTETYTASVETGEAPFTYQWYRDWELVSTSDTYTDIFDGDGSVDLRLDVIDARGEAASSGTSVWVSSCFPQLVC